MSEALGPRKSTPMRSPRAIHRLPRPVHCLSVDPPIRPDSAERLAGAVARRAATHSPKASCRSTAPTPSRVPDLRRITGARHDLRDYRMSKRPDRVQAHCVAGRVADRRRSHWAQFGRRHVDGGARELTITAVILRTILMNKVTPEESGRLAAQIPTTTARTIARSPR